MTILIHTPTPNLSQSLDFYQKLNFNILSHEHPLLVTDGQAVIEINPDRYARAGIKVFTDDIQGLISTLQGVSTLVETKEGHLLDDPSGVRMYIPNSKPELELPPNKEAFSRLGRFAGISIETADMNRSAELWNALGFTKQSGSQEQGWLAMTNELGLTVSFMKPNSCPHLFFNPSLTYFNGSNNLDIITGIRDLEIPITEEITVFNESGIVDNIIIRDPGGYGFFLFND